MILRDILELGYFTAGIVLAIAALIGLYQISLSKKDIAFREARASKEKAMEYSEIFESKFLPLINVYIEECKINGLADWGEYKQLKDFKKSIFDLCKTQQKIGLKVWFPALNILEYIAASFVLGVADDESGYLLLGDSFCNAVYGVHDLIVEERISGGSSAYMDMTIELYKRWAPRYQKECFPIDEPE